MLGGLARELSGSWQFCVLLLFPLPFFLSGRMLGMLQECLTKHQCSAHQRMGLLLRDHEVADLEYSTSRGGICLPGSTVVLQDASMLWLWGLGMVASG